MALPVVPGCVGVFRGYGALLQDLFGKLELADNLFARADAIEDERSISPPTAGLPDSTS